MGITQKELAKRLGVAQVTVSRALRDGKGVNETLRRRILREAARAGYSIEASNFEARMMRQRAAGVEVRTDVICAIVFDEDDSSGFGGRILRGMNQEGERIGSEIVMVTHCRGSLPRIVSRGQVDGAIRLLGDLEFTSGVAPTPVPWVSILYDVPEVDLIAVDNFEGARQVGEYVCAQGHQRIAFIGPVTPIAQERLAGLRAAAQAAGAEVPDELVGMQRFAGDKGPTRELLTHLMGPAGPPPFTALVAYNDYMAATAIEFATERGLAVPQDLSVAGFDGVLPADARGIRVRLTTAAVPLEELGVAAVRRLRQRIQQPDEPRKKIVLSTTFVPGESVALVADPART